jgi:hypothetical protein
MVAPAPAAAGAVGFAAAGAAGAAAAGALGAAGAGGAGGAGFAGAGAAGAGLVSAARAVEAANSDAARDRERASADTGFIFMDLLEGWGDAGRIYRKPMTEKSSLIY